MTREEWQRRFDDFVAAKTREAVAASLPPYISDGEDAPAGMEPIGSRWTRARFDGDFYVSPPPASVRPACNLVFVQSRDGNTGARDPSSLGGGQTDKHLIYEGLSRVAADGVLSGAETVRGGNVVLSVWHPELVQLRALLGKPRHPAQIVATIRGLDLDRGLLFNVASIRVLLVTIAATAAQMRMALADRPWIETIVMEGASDLADALRHLRSRGLERLSCIGGRTLAAALIDGGLIQDLYLTTSPRTGGDPSTPLYPRPLMGRFVVRKQGTGPETGVVFEHLVI